MQRDILAELARVESSTYPVTVCIRTFREMAEVRVDMPAIQATYRQVLTRHAAERPGALYFLATASPEAFAAPDCLGVPFTIIGRSIGNEAAPENLHVLTRCREYVLGFSSRHW